MRTYGVPWGQPLDVHELHTIVDVGARTRGLVSKLYKRLVESSCKPLAIHQIWERDLDFSDGVIDWMRVWDNLEATSKNPNHRLIHFNLIHRLYLTPRKRHLMKLVPTPTCDLFSLGQMGSFLHMFWECPDVVAFWKLVSSVLSDLTGENVPYCPKLLLLNDTSSLDLSAPLSRVLFAGLTAAKKMLALAVETPTHSQPDTVTAVISGHSLHGTICRQNARGKG